MHTSVLAILPSRGSLRDSDNIPVFGPQGEAHLVVSSSEHSTTMSSSTTGLDYLTLVIAIGGFLLSAISIVWQFFTWRSEGARIRVDRPYWATMFGGDEHEDGVAIQVRNVGRSPIQLVGIYGKVGTKNFFWRVPPDQYQLPVTLTGLHSLSWLIPERALRTVDCSKRDLRIGFGLATGKTVWSPKGGMARQSHGAAPADIEGQ